ncbi:MAG TPA: hypothetical protein VIQ81_04015 [Gammaproteobacteria bacterium]
MDDVLQLVDECLLPPQTRELVKIIDLPDTIKLLEAYGGQRVWIPLGKSHDTYLHKTISHESVMKLASSQYAGQRLTLPKADKILSQIRNLHIQSSPNVPKSVLARQYNLTVRQVQRIRNDDDDNPTLDMFDDMMG